ncbi:2-oxo acid dehydrogenase subunit E2 [Bradyrhizobium viridifuturi]|uniref:2-oxo acid dehydrogenase subunit E2 n=1 Tax=uncultured Bradyrhizobium sp. TaxID=199684 RepID=UPI001BA5218C|nr:2-oxo acid dehydrogenase subunit E2 [uncultured Bradyrhizobium sp.]MBR1040662.1 2-oxo acid dehydrogenase subunit E2 [Bradyrhizobium viridifuturi]MBR1074950.1 2-oxo acid dehydrogenase subunit E2 [Bradyrhizobium viridifuturi]
MTKLGLALNETKTVVRNARHERFDFLGYSFGPHYCRKDGHWYLGASPSKKSVQRLRAKERGLFAPVIRDAGGLPLDALAGAANAIAERAKAGQLLADELAGGAIAVSNVGMYGASHLVPIINPGQSAILGVAGIKQVFRPDANEQPVLRREIGLVLSCDHRVLNGVAAARFLDCITGILQSPLNLLRV